MKKQDTPYKTDFLLGKDLKTDIILRSPFINLWKPFIADEHGIKTVKSGQEIVFEFVLRN